MGDNCCLRSLPGRHPLVVAIVIDFGTIPDPPCETCGNYERCKSGLACTAFRAYIILSRWEAQHANRLVNRIPRRAIYQDIFGGDNERAPV